MNKKNAFIAGAITISIFVLIFAAVFIKSMLIFLGFVIGIFGLTLGAFTLFLVIYAVLEDEGGYCE